MVFKNVYFILFLLFLAVQSEASSSLCFLNYEQSPAKKLDVQSALENLILDPDVVEEFSSLLNPTVQDQEDEGKNNYGVYKVHVSTQNQPVALKLTKNDEFNYLMPNASRLNSYGQERGIPVIFNSELEKYLFSGKFPGESSFAFQQYLAIHLDLAKRNYAPQLLGVIGRPSLNKLYDDKSSRFQVAAEMFRSKIPVSEIVRLRNSTIGILMEELKGAWNLSREMTATNNMFKSWSIDDVENAIDKLVEIVRFVNRAKYYTNDIQFVATANKQIKLIDLDTFRFSKIYHSGDPAFRHAMNTVKNNLYFKNKNSSNKGNPDELSADSGVREILQPPPIYELETLVTSWERANGVAVPQETLDRWRVIITQID